MVKGRLPRSLSSCSFYYDLATFGRGNDRGGIDHLNLIYLFIYLFFACKIRLILEVVGTRIDDDELSQS